MVKILLFFCYLLLLSCSPASALSTITCDEVTCEAQDSSNINLDNLLPGEVRESVITLHYTASKPAILSFSQTTNNEYLNSVLHVCLLTEGKKWCLDQDKTKKIEVEELREGTYNYIIRWSLDPKARNEFQAQKARVEIHFHLSDKSIFESYVEDTLLGAYDAVKDDILGATATAQIKHWSWLGWVLIAALVTGVLVWYRYKR